jgi:hypothetical protein
MFDAGEVKNIRSISQLVLKSRAIEKKQIEGDLQQQRTQLKEMQDVLGSMNANLLTNTTSISKSESKEPSSVGDFVVNGKVVSSGTKTVRRPEKRRPVAVLQKQKVLSSTIKKLDTLRAPMEKTIPGKWNFWAEKKDSDYRAEKVISANLHVKQELEKLVANNDVNSGKINALKDRLTLTRKMAPFENLKPTLETRIKHRK